MDGLKDCELVIDDPQLQCLTLVAGGKEVTFHPDGRVTYGGNYTPVEAALVFWEACERLNPLRETVLQQAAEIARLKAADAH